VRHVGSAHDEAEIGLLVEQAHRMLADDAQGMLDLGITPQVTRASLLAPVRGLVLGQDVRLVLGGERAALGPVNSRSHAPIINGGIGQGHRHRLLLASRPVQGKELRSGVSPQPDAQGKATPVSSRVNCGVDRSEASPTLVGW